MARMLKANNNRIRSIPGRFRYLLLLATVCCICIYILSITNNTDIMIINIGQSTSILDINDSYVQPYTSYTIKTKGCTIPGLQPYDDSVKEFKETPKLALCPQANNSLLQRNETHIWIDTEVIEYYNIPRHANISCCYKSFYRPPAIKDVFSKYVDDRAQYETCENFSHYKEVLHEFVKVSCEYKRNLVYEQYFLFARKKPNYKKRVEANSQNQTSHYNVLVMGIDAVSRLNFYRTMSKTLTYLREKGSIELLGYNKVADNTFPNLMPMLLGLEEKELKKTCLPNDDANFDNCPFVWQWYKDAGFYTALGEDSANLGTFNYGKVGFIKTPTDYYTHTLIYEAEKHVGNMKELNSYMCMGSKYFYQVLLDYIEDLTSTLRYTKLFGFFWEVTMSHDFLNYPMAMDDSYVNLFQRLNEFNYLDNTVLILLSDHGIRWGGIRYTKQGRLEERLPFLYILLPDSFKEMYKLAYDNLKQNGRRLTTPFDVHETLSDLVDLGSITDAKINARIQTSYSNNRGISLFLPIPTNRTCEMAGVSEHWCTCNRGMKLATLSSEAREAAKQLMRLLNGLLSEYPQCALLSVAEVMEVSELVAGQEEDDETGWREFMVVARAAPSGGVFEATLRQADTERWTLSGTVSRLNLYGNQSYCVNDYHLKLYCYCLL